MMKRLAAVLLVTFFVIGCGGSPPPPPPAAKSPAPPPVANGKWDPAVFTNAVNGCAQVGASQYSPNGNFSQWAQQWTQFCTCAYSFAATRWDFATFRYYFDECYSQMQPQITTCLQQANIPVNSINETQIQQDLAAVYYY